jgi:hypothetical protein
VVAEVTQRLTGEIVVARLAGGLERPVEPAGGAGPVAGQVVADQAAVERSPAPVRYVRCRGRQRLGPQGERRGAARIAAVGPESQVAVRSDQLAAVVVLQLQEFQLPLVPVADGAPGRGDRVRRPAWADRPEVVVDRGGSGRQREPPRGLVTVDR